MRFEEVLDEVGGFHRFQFVILHILSIPRVILPLNFLLHNFISAVPPHHCALPHLDDRYADHTPQPQLLPHDPDGALSSCRQFPELENFNSSGTGSNGSVPCQYGWTYDRRIFNSTTATEWDLVCDSKHLNQALATFFFMGVMMGAVLFGYLADRFGRKPMLLVSFVSSCVLGVAIAFSSSFLMFAICRTLSGVALTGMSITTLALSIEWTGIKHRTFSGTILSLGWSVGNMLLALLAYLLRDWRHLMLAVTAPCILAIATWWWVPESARWLLVNGRVEEAQRVLQQCAKMNGKTSKLDKETLLKVTINEEPSKDHSYLDLVKTPKLRKISLCSGIVWFAVAFTYYGISFNISGFGLNAYLTQFIYGAIEVPAKVGTYFLLDRIGRRNGQAWSLILCGMLIGANTAIPSGYSGVRTGVAVCGKGFSEAAFTIAFLYTAELFPTVIRQCGLGYTSFMGRLGGSLAPLLIMLDDVWISAPSLVFSIAAVISGCVAFLLPETLRVRLPETIQDVEEGRHTMAEVEMSEMNPNLLVSREEEN